MAKVRRIIRVLRARESGIGLKSNPSSRRHAQNNFETPRYAVLAGTPGFKTNLAAVPGELALGIFESLDLASVLAMSATCRRFHQLYLAQKGHIVFTVLQSDPHFGPSDGIFRVLAMSPADVEGSGLTWLPKEIRFRRQVLCKGAVLSSSLTGKLSGVPDLKKEEIAPAVTVRLEDADADRAIQICKLVRDWELIFPYYRFLDHPEDLRVLNVEEGRRLRAALYVWIRYHFYFHGDLRRPYDSYRMRTNMLLMLDSGELTDLEDLWETVRSVVEWLCPCLAVVVRDAPHLSLEEAGRVAWGSEGNWDIVSTMMQLGPEKLLYYVKHRHLYTKEQLIDEVRRERPGMEAQIESLSHSLRVVLRMYQAPDHHDGRSSAGILDWEEGRQPARPWFRAGGCDVLWHADEDTGDGIDDATLLGFGTLTE